MNIVRAAARRNLHGRICVAASESVCTVGIETEDGCVAIDSHLESRLECMRATNVGHIFSRLVHVSIGAGDGAAGSVKRLIESVGELESRLRMIEGRKLRRAAYVTGRSFKGQMHGSDPGVGQPEIPLPVDEADGKARIDGDLAGVGRGA